jgi:flagellar biosynthesis chaperone FliJ
VADENVDLSIKVETGDSTAELDRVRDASREAGEQLDKLDGERASVDIEVDSKGAEDGLNRVREASDGARDSIGNTSGEGAAQLAELAGASGPVAEGLSQITENALSGGASLKGLALAGGALAGLQLVMYGLEQRAKNAQERLDDFREAVDNLSKVADDQVLDEFGRSLANRAFDAEDMSSVLKEIAEQDLPGFRRTLDIATQSGEVNAEMLGKMRDALAQVEAEMAQQERTTEQYGDNLDAAAAGATVLEGVLAGSFVEVLGEVEGAMAGAAAATGELNRQTDELLGRIDDRQAWLNAQEAVEDYVTTLGDSEASTRDQERAWLNAAETLVRYVQGLEGVPESVETEVLAAVNEGDIGKAYAILDELTRTRTVTLNIATGSVSGALAGIFAGIGRSTRSTEVAAPAAPTIINYNPPRLSPTEQFRAQRTYTRVYGG